MKIKSPRDFWAGLMFIAFGLVALHFGQKLALGTPVLLLYLRHAPTTVLETAADYGSFMTLLGSLFVITGGPAITTHMGKESLPRNPVLPEYSHRDALALLDDG